MGKWEYSQGHGPSDAFRIVIDVSTEGTFFPSSESPLPGAVLPCGNSSHQVPTMNEGVQLPSLREFTPNDT